MWLSPDCRIVDPFGWVCLLAAMAIGIDFGEFRSEQE
jgi:hypothetical protein